MRPIRTCEDAHLNTGLSKCPIDFARMAGAILVPYGTKLPAELTADKLTQLAHAGVNTRIYGIKGFVEYAPEGGEAQTGAVGYGGLKVTGYSDRADTFTLDQNYPCLHASLTKCANKAWGAYFFDKKNYLYGLNDGTDMLAPFPMSTVHSNATPYPTSSAISTMTIKFCHEDAREAIESADYFKLNFKPQRACLGLTAVKLVKVGEEGNDYKVVEATGGFDRTTEVGAMLEDGKVILSGVSSMTFDETKNVLTAVAAEDGGEIKLKSPAELLEAGVEGIEQV